MPGGAGEAIDVTQKGCMIGALAVHGYLGGFGLGCQRKQCCGATHIFTEQMWKQKQSKQHCGVDTFTNACTMLS